MAVLGCPCEIVLLAQFRFDTPDRFLARPPLAPNSRPRGTTPWARQSRRGP